MDVVLEFINQLFLAFNDIMDAVFLWGGLGVILSYPAVFLVQNIRKSQKEKKANRDLIPQMLILSIVVILAAIVWMSPELMILVWYPWFNWLPGTLLRWVMLMLVALYFVYTWAHENGEKRWWYSFTGHFGLLFLSLLLGRWTGILFIMAPLLLGYYWTLYSLAIIILPTSEPDNRTEKWKRFVVLAAYTWGLQFPVYVLDGNAWKKPDLRIPGDFSWDYPVPGLVWAKSHQVVEISGGVKLKRVDGPGLVFTGKLERPDQVFDLRLQTRLNEIEVVSKDGIGFKARVLAVFRMDPDTWDKDTYDKLRLMNTILRGADKPNYTQGSFPYSSLRVQAALGITSTKAVAGAPLIYWDQWVLSNVEDQARKILSQKNLDELWRPAEDKKNANALDAIANELKGNVSPLLRSAGILLVASRVVNFSFNDQEVPEQQIATWSSEWARKRAQIISEAESESERAQQEARAYAESVLLNSIAEGLQKTQEINENLPRYVIAVRFLSALQDYIHKQPDEKNMGDLQTQFKEWQEKFAPHSGKEK
jgi:hypothetical protein